MSLLAPLPLGLHDPERLRAILRDFYSRMAKDVLIGFFFANRDTTQIAERQLEFLLKAMGITKEYTGKIPARAHDDLAPILKGHFDRRLRILDATLHDHGVSDEDIRTWVAFEKQFEKVIVKPRS